MIKIILFNHILTLNLIQQEEIKDCVKLIVPKADLKAIHQCRKVIKPN